MECGDPHIHAAMDGHEFHAGTNKPSYLGKREEPTAFFFVIFGLVYEALATSSTESTSPASAQASVIAALQALKCLVRPEYSGMAIREPTIFEEFISLCYRIAITESARITVHLLEMLSVFATSQDQESG
jgi:hypothetical protein